MINIHDEDSLYTHRSLVILDPSVGRRDIRDLLQWFQSHATLRRYTLDGEEQSPEVFRQFNVAMLPLRSRVLVDFQCELLEFGIRWIEPERKLRAPEFASETGAQPFDALNAMAVRSSKAHGSGITVAVLDTGFDFTHPDFRMRHIEHASFVRNQPAQDGHGHGTHCVGLACGPRQLDDGSAGYGVADESKILVARVLDDYKSGCDGDLIAGLHWAACRGADVIALCLGASRTLQTPPSVVLEHVARRLLVDDRLVIAAGGEDGGATVVGPVGHPANCNAIMAVGALGVDLMPHAQSPGLTPAGDPIDICAPGENIRSSSPMPGRYMLRSGTSMAAALTAGVAALWAEYERVRGVELWRTLMSRAKEIANFEKAGAGLVQAP